MKKQFVAITLVFSCQVMQFATAEPETPMAESYSMQGSSRTGMSENAEIFGYLEDVVSFGHRRTGSDAGVGAAHYIADSFRAFGLDNVVIEQGKAIQWEARHWSLNVNGQDIRAFYMPRSFHPSVAKAGVFSTGPEGLGAEIVYIGDRTDFDDVNVKGKIVLADVELGLMDFSAEEGVGVAAHHIQDADGSLENSGHINPFAPNNYPLNFIEAMDRGAAGFVGILVNYIDSSYYHNEDVAYMVRSDAYLEIPGLWVTKAQGEIIKQLIADSSSPTSAVLRLEGELTEVTYNTVLGILPGKSDDIIMVQSHHDSAFLGAVEDASGASEVLALAKYYGAQGGKERERSLMFITMDTHFTEYESHEDFAEKYILNHQAGHIVANVTVEHIAQEMTVENGQGVLTGRVEPRMLIVSDDEALLDLTQKAVELHDYQRSMIFPGSVFAEEITDGIPTDADFVYRSGVPVISLLSAPLYLYDIQDTVDKVAVEELKPTALLLADLIDALDGMSLKRQSADTDE